MSMAVSKAVVGASLQEFRALMHSQAARIKVEAGGGEVNRLRINDQLVFRLCEEGRITEAIEALDLLVQRGSYVGRFLLYHVVKGCMGKENIVLGKRVHDLSLKSGYQSNVFLANHMIGMFASHGKLEEAMTVFDKVAAPNVHMWASIILALARHGQPAQAIRLYRRMQESDVKPDNHVFVAVLKACASAVDLKSGKQVHADILRNEVHLNVFVSSCLVDMYAKCGSLEDARRVFDTLSKKNVVTWTAMIAGYAQHGLGQEALEIYAMMLQESITPANDVTFMCLLQACASVGDLHQGKELHLQIQAKGLEANVAVGNCLVDMYAKCGSLKDARQVFDNMLTRDVVTWTAMIAGYAQHGLGQEALALYGSMQQQDMTPGDIVTFVCLLQACTTVGALHQGKQLHGQILQRGLDRHVVIGNCLVNMYSKCGSLEDARRIFDNLPTRDVVTWNAMISGYAQHDLSQQALRLGSDMQNEGSVLANAVTFACLLKACASVGALNQGKHLHAQIQERGLESEVVVSNALVDMYAKCGSLDDARRLFNGLQTRDVVTWNALLHGYAEHSAGQMAVECFRDMQQQGVEPNDATFISLLVACSHEGLLDEGRRYFQLMLEDYGIAPKVTHYNCMVDLLGRSGCLDEAENMLLTTPFENDVVGWTSLMSSCKSHGDVERGRRCFHRLVTLEPENGTAYVLFATMCANAGRWTDACDVETFRRSAGARKKPAKACIEVKRKVHEFTVGEERADLSLPLRRINSGLKDRGGHVPQTELVTKPITEGEKEDALCGHAEKLALAYGLMNTPYGTTLLVTKNLRMCNDCHSSTKIMSLLEKREIIVRDAHRVHHFADGSCSCRDLH